MAKFIIFILIAAGIEVAMLIGEKRRNIALPADPAALPYKARRVDEPSFGYIPGRSTYNEKTQRYVTDWKYEWEYRGEKHTMMFCDDHFSQYEHYLATFPEEIDITIHKETGKYYVSKTARAASRKSFLTLIIPIVLSWIITSMIFK